MIILADDMMMAYRSMMNYLLSKGVCSLMVRVMDFEDFFNFPEQKKDFIESFDIVENYRIGVETLLLQIKKK